MWRLWRWGGGGGGRRRSVECEGDAVCCGGMWSWVPSVAECTVVSWHHHSIAPGFPTRLFMGSNRLFSFSCLIALLQKHPATREFVTRHITVALAMLCCTRRRLRPTEDSKRVGEHLSLSIFLARQCTTRHPASQCAEQHTTPDTCYIFIPSSPPSPMNR